MAENNRNQDVNPGTQDNTSNQNPGNQSQTTSRPQEQQPNPQDGDQWNNYRKREYSEQGGGAGNATTPKTNP
jgi:hypothetical protein